MTFLIDGYNLMHAIGLVRKGLPEGGLELARIRFLDWLATSLHGRRDVLRVVFDAQNAPRDSPESDHRGVRVLFAFHQTADDLIEELLAADSTPMHTTVVSNDTRIQTAGRRRGAGVYTSEQFIDWLIADPASPRPLAPPKPEKPERSASAEELASWLSVFSTPKRKRR